MDNYRKVEGEEVVLLIIEDNPDHAEFIKRNLEDHLVANRLYHVADGESALDYLFRRGIYEDPHSSPRPHVIFLDLRLPKIDGLEVLREIKTAEPLRRIPVIVLTSSEDEKDVALAYDNNVNSYLVKPIDFDSFTNMMKDLGFYWLIWNYTPGSD